MSWAEGRDAISPYRYSPFTEMYSITDRGSRPSSALPSLTLSRIEVDETASGATGTHVISASSFNSTSDTLLLIVFGLAHTARSN